MNQRTGKLMMYKALHPKADILVLYMSRKEQERKFARYRGCINTGIKDCIKKSKERLMTAESSSTDVIKIKRTAIPKNQK